MGRNSRKTDCRGPFALLAELLPDLPPDRRAPAGPSRPVPSPAGHFGHHRDIELFREAMSDVVPIDRDNVAERHLPKTATRGCRDVENEVLQQLRRLVECGEGFDWRRTPEYIEGCGDMSDQRLLQSLQRGEFAIQDHLDLHGLPVREARRAFDVFLDAALRDGKRALLIIHGRGLSSPDEPVLKKNVQRWLHRNRWRRWLLAYTSARSCDGGTGATYVLLRRRPLDRRRARGHAGGK